jgi:hypothetical protein
MPFPRASFRHLKPIRFPITLVLGISRGIGFITKLNTAGNQLLYSTFIPNATPVGIALDPQGNVYLASGANPHDFPFPVTAGAFQTSTSTSTTTGLVAKLNAAGSALPDSNQRPTTVPVAGR